MSTFLLCGLSHMTLVFLHQAWLAQSVEHETLNLRVVGSSPTSGEDVFFFYHLAIWNLRVPLLLSNSRYE